MFDDLFIDNIDEDDENLPESVDIDDNTSSEVLESTDWSEKELPDIFDEEDYTEEFSDNIDAIEGVYKKLPSFIAITPENIEPWLTTYSDVKQHSKEYLYQLTNRQIALQKMLAKVDKGSQDYKDIVAEMKCNKESAKKIMKAREKFGLSDIQDDKSFASIFTYGLLGNKLSNQYISKNKSVLEASESLTMLDDYNDESEEEIDEFLDELGITDEDIELMDDEDIVDATEGTKLTKSQKTALKIINSKPVAVTNVLIYDTIGKRVEQNNHNIYYKKYLKYKELAKRNPQNQLFKKKRAMYYILSTAMTTARHQSYKTLNKALKAKESAEFFEFDPAMEADALTNDLNKLASMDGSQEEPDNGGGEDVDENEKPLAPKPKSTDVAGEADKQLEEDGQTVDELDMMENRPQENEDNNVGAEDNGNPDTDAEQTRDDPLKSIETKRAYKNKFVYLYNVITDSLNAMESFTPEYTSPLAQDYYTIRSNLTKLKQIIYKICVERISKMTVDEVLRKYSTANHIFDISSNQLKEFFNKYAKERDKLTDKKIKLSDTKESESKRKKKLHIN